MPCQSVRCRQTARRRGQSRRLWISLPSRGESPCHSYASDASLRDVQFEHSGRATYGDPVRGKRGRCPSGSPATSAARAWRDRLQARAARDFAPSNGTRQKHSCTDTCRRRDSPPQIALSGGDRDTGDGAQLGVSSAHARALVAPPSLCIFHTAFIRRRMVLALVQDWASSAAVPLMGGPRVGATSNPRPGIRAEGAPDSSIRWAPVHSLELITLRSSRPFADWTAVRCVVALSCTLSCLVVVTRE